MYKPSLLILFLFFTLSEVSFCQTNMDTPGQSFAQGNYEACIKACDQELKTDANNSQANFFKGAALIKLKKYEEAKPCLKQAKKLSYQPLAAVNANLLRAHAGLKETAALNNLLKELATNGFGAITVLDEAEFEYLKDDTTFAKLKLKVDANAYPCRYGEPYKRLDFWLGEWDVYVNNKKIGTSSITKSEGGCTLYEDYKTFTGFLGRSTNYYDPADQKYTQIWIDKFNSITVFKEAAAKENYLQMFVEKSDGSFTRMSYQLDTTTGNVTQTLEDSQDKGETWTVSFVGVYKKREK